MDAAQVIDLGREALWVAVLVAAPLLGTALAVGLFIGIFQAATSIQEMTLSFIPKLAIMVVALLVFGSWQIAVMVDFFRRIFERIPALFFVMDVLVSEVIDYFYKLLWPMIRVSAFLLAAPFFFLTGCDCKDTGVASSLINMACFPSNGLAGDRPN